MLRSIAGVLGLVVLGLALGAGGWLAYDEFAADDADAVTTAAPTSTTTTPPGTVVADPTPGPIRIAFFGDVHAEQDLAARLAEDPATFVGPFAELLTSVDLAIGNVETAIVADAARAGQEFRFGAPPALLDALAAAGVDVVSMANDHAIDLGAEGLAETLEARAARSQPAVIGIGANEADAYRAEVRQVAGVSIAVVAATQTIRSAEISGWTATIDQAGVASAKRADRLAEAVEDAAAVADTVVVYVHFGTQGEACPSASQQELVELLVDAGADVIVGSGARRVQGGGWSGDAVVHYGVGNFVFRAGSPEAATTGVFVVDLDADGSPVDYDWVPGRIDAGVPARLSGAEFDEARSAWDELRACTGLAADRP